MIMQGKWPAGNDRVFSYKPSIKLPKWEGCLGYLKIYK